ncbi:MAG TPA: hypothetical protein VGV87_08380 [Blastocatellia bacterium]|nr:hypothetical protein [Blastocatellia bacterium]
MKQRRRTAEAADIAQEILAYLAAHPRAQDTMEGILQWWLLEQDIKRTMAQVKSALGELVSQGLVMERQEKDGRIHYRINRRQIARIRALLEQMSEQEAAQ